MKLNQIALAVLAVGVTTAATAGVTVTPMIGYTYTDEAHDKQRGVFKTGTDLTNTPKNTSLNQGVALESDLYTGVALGVELTAIYPVPSRVWRY